MKALTIPASRPSMRERMRTGIKIGSATVSNLRARIDGNFTDFCGFFAEKLAQSGFFSELCSANQHDSQSVPRSVGNRLIHPGLFFMPVSDPLLEPSAGSGHTRPIHGRHPSILCSRTGTASCWLATDGTVFFFIHGRIQTRGKAAPESSRTLTNTMQ